VKRPAEILIIFLLLISSPALSTAVDGIRGPLTQSENPNYFKDANGNVLILNGSQTWNTLQDWGSNGAPQALDFHAFVQFLTKHQHNFTLLWSAELPKFCHFPSVASGPPNVTVTPLPWLRTGPGRATDGGLKFDLRKFNPSYFDRLRARVEALYHANIYAGVYLFTGEFLNIFRCSNDGYPFTGPNNVNGVDDGYRGNSKQGIGAVTMTALNDITKFQDLYVEKVIDILNDLPNVLWIVSEEAPPNSTWWNDHQIAHIRAYESQKPYQHPIGYATPIDTPDSVVYNSDADWVAPLTRISPVSTCGRGKPACKVNVNDSDHSYFGMWNETAEQNRNFEWQNFMNGNQVMFMDPYVVYYPREKRNLCVSPKNLICSSPDRRYENFRDNLGYILQYSRKLALGRVRPQKRLSSTGYCLAQTPSNGAEYLIYSSSGGPFTVDLSAMSASRRLKVEWFNPSTGATLDAPAISAGSPSQSFTPPFVGDAVLYVVDTAGHATSAGQASQETKQDPFLAWMDRIAQEQLTRREAAVAAIRDVPAAEQRKQWVRKTILSVIGGLPDYSGPLHPKITGSIQAEGYTIEKVIFQSLPGFYVTANLYRPNRPGRYPGVLLQAGHTQEGKPEGQRLAANLALKGFVVLAFDPVGQGEREQTFNRQVDRPLAGWSVPEHIQAGAQSMLIGESVARYFIWDAKRALDYLISRPEVDPDRLGAVGCSGGGALTTFIGALDPRVKAVAPACYINSYRLLFAGPDPDSEMSWPNFLASGLDMADYVELSAPKPWLILATEGDYFTPSGARLVYDEARRWFSLYNAEDKLRFFVGSGPHGTPLETREAIYKWMIRWLKAGHAEFHEQPVKLYSNDELRVTTTGNVENEPNSRKLYQLILDEFRAKERQGTVPELRAELRKLNVPSEGNPPELQISDEPGNTNVRRQRIRFESEPGVEISGVLYVPHASGRKPAVLVVADETSSYWIPSTASLSERLAAMGRVVLELQPRDSSSQDDRRPYVGNWLANARADQIGRNLPAMRAHDILRGVDVLAARDDVDRGSIRATARSVKGIWLLLAASADTRIQRIWLDRTPYSLRAALQSTMNTDLFDAVIPGFALHWDLDDLAKTMGNRPVLWTDPTNWMGRIVPLGPPFRYRYVIGDTTDLRDEQDNAYIKDFIR
jgi:cephalosporin-C deacetylase-like acetyl esterase